MSGLSGPDFDWLPNDRRACFERVRALGVELCEEIRKDLSSQEGHNLREAVVLPSLGNVFNGGRTRLAYYEEELPGITDFFVVLENNGYARNVGPGQIPIYRLSEEFVIHLLEARESAGSMSKEWDVFICHATEDKEAFVADLAETLTSSGLSVWYDRYELRLGDSLRRKIDEGLSLSRYGIVVLSHAFFSREWTQKELDGLTARECDGKKVILPVWHGLSRADVAKYSPTLAGLYAVKSGDGIAAVVEAVLRAIRPEDASGQEAKRRRKENAEDISNDAYMLVELLVKRSINGCAFDPVLTVEEIERDTGLQTQRVVDAIKDLIDHGLAGDSSDATAEFGYAELQPDPVVFARFDSQFMDWNPERDARELAEKLVAKTWSGVASEAFASEIGWKLRRLNPALKYLLDRSIVDDTGECSSANLVVNCVLETARTRRWVRGE